MSDPSSRGSLASETQLHQPMLGAAHSEGKDGCCGQSTMHLLNTRLALPCVRKQHFTPFPPAPSPSKLTCLGCFCVGFLFGLPSKGSRVQFGHVSAAKMEPQSTQNGTKMTYKLRSTPTLKKNEKNNKMTPPGDPWTLENNDFAWEGSEFQENWCPRKSHTKCLPN